MPTTSTPSMASPAIAATASARLDRRGAAPPPVTGVSFAGSVASGSILVAPSGGSAADQPGVHPGGLIQLDECGDVTATEGEADPWRGAVEDRGREVVHLGVCLLHTSP